jgi:hypothetical protein
MSLEDQLTKLVVPPSGLATETPELISEAKGQLQAEEKFWQSKHQEQQIADQAAARVQREKYANRVFYLVSAWITAIFFLLIAQCVLPRHWFTPLSDKVLITLITSTTINLIGTLIIVLNYIFRVQRSGSQGSV